MICHGSVPFSRDGPSPHSTETSYPRPPDVFFKLSFRDVCEHLRCCQRLGEDIEAGDVQSQMIAVATAITTAIATKHKGQHGGLTTACTI